MKQPRIILHVTPYFWHPPSQNIQLGIEDEIQTAVWEIAKQQASCGERTAILVPATTAKDSLLLDEIQNIESCFANSRGPVVIAIDEGNQPAHTKTQKPFFTATGTAKQVEQFLATSAIDICHIHEPITNSLASIALRNAQSLTVCSFYLEPKLSELAKVKQLKRMVLDRADEFVTFFQATKNTVAHELDRQCHLLTPGNLQHQDTADQSNDAAQLVYVDSEERGSFRRLLKVVAQLVETEIALPWKLTVITTRERSITNQKIAKRIDFVSPTNADSVVAKADICLGFSTGAKPTPLTLLQLVNQGATPVVSDLPLYQDFVRSCQRGSASDPHEITAFATQIARAIHNPQLRNKGKKQHSWVVTTNELQTMYESLLAKRKKAPISARAQQNQRPRIDVDLHMHTNHSYDCATPVDTLLATAKSQGFGAIAITDHNEITGAFEAAAKAEQYGVKVIVAEEVKTADQGEVIGLFLKEKIARGMTLGETVAEIKRQGGLVYVPHPFDRLHSIPDYRHLRDVIDDIDAIEVFNARVAISSFNDEAHRFAQKYRIPAGAGSDAHVPQGLGSVRIRMHDFDGPQEFLASLQTAEIIRAPASLLYVQALKFWQTKARPR